MAIRLAFQVMKKILKDIKIPIQGGLDPKVLLTDYENLKKEDFDGFCEKVGKIYQLQKSLLIDENGVFVKLNELDYT